MFIWLHPWRVLGSGDSSVVYIDNVSFNTFYTNKCFSAVTNSYYGSYFNARLNLGLIPLNLKAGIPNNIWNDKIFSIPHYKLNDLFSISFDRRDIIKPTHLDSHKEVFDTKLNSFSTSLPDTSKINPDAFGIDSLRFLPTKENPGISDHTFKSGIENNIKIESFSLFRGIRNDDQFVFNSFVFKGASLGTRLGRNAYILATGGENDEPVITGVENYSSLNGTRFFRVRAGWGSLLSDHIHFEFIEGKNSVLNNNESSSSTSLHLTSLHLAYSLKQTKFKMQWTTSSEMDIHHQPGYAAFGSVYHAMDKMQINLSAMYIDKDFRTINGAPVYPGLSAINVSMTRTTKMYRLSLLADNESTHFNINSNQSLNFTINYSKLNTDGSKKIETQLNNRFFQLAGQHQSVFNEFLLNAKRNIRINRNNSVFCVAPSAKAGDKLNRTKSFQLNSFVAGSGVEVSAKRKKWFISYYTGILTETSEINKSQAIEHAISANVSLSRKLSLMSSFQSLSRNWYIPAINTQIQFNYRIAKGMNLKAQYSHYSTNLKTYNYEFYTGFSCQI